MNYVIPEVLVNLILKYLEEQKYKDVKDLINALLTVQPVTLIQKGGDKNGIQSTETNSEEKQSSTTQNGGQESIRQE